MLRKKDWMIIPVEPKIKHNVAICLGTAFYFINWLTLCNVNSVSVVHNLSVLVHQLKMYKILGVTKVFLPVHSMTVDVQKVVHYFEQSDYLEVILSLIYQDRPWVWHKSLVP